VRGPTFCPMAGTSSTPWPGPIRQRAVFTSARSATRTVASTVSRLVDGTEGANNPFWSPDNPTIAFFYGAANRGRGPAGRRGSDRTPERGYLRSGAVWSGVVTLGRSAMIRMLRKWI
jgi:hypothetical protein